MLTDIHALADLFLCALTNINRPSWKKSMPSLVGSGGLEFRRTIPLILLLSYHGKTSVKP
jgi:hypothetical protein